MGERKLERISATDNRFFLYGYPFLGSSLKFVSGPEMTKDIQQGSWLDTWDTIEGKRRLGFGPQEPVAFATKEAAIDAKTRVGEGGRNNHRSCGIAGPKSESKVSP